MYICIIEDSENIIMTKIGHCILIREAKVYLLMLTRNLHPYISTYRQRDKWKLSSPSSIAGGPQK